MDYFDITIKSYFLQCFISSSNTILFYIVEDFL